MLNTERENIKEESHHEVKRSMESHILNYNHGYESSETHLELEECIEDPAAPVEPVIERARLRVQSEMGTPYEQVASESNHERYVKGTMYCKKSTEGVMKTYISRPEIIKDKSKPHANIKMRKETAATGSEKVFLAASPAHSSSTTYTGVTMRSINRQGPILPAAPEWRPRGLGQARGVRGATVVTGVLAVVLTLVCLVWYAKTWTRKGKIVSLGRGGVSVGPWDERAEQGMVVYEGREYRE